MRGSAYRFKLDSLCKIVELKSMIIKLLYYNL